jgi:hypothetical protein
VFYLRCATAVLYLLERRLSFYRAMRIMPRPRVHLYDHVWSIMSKSQVPAPHLHLPHVIRARRSAQSASVRLARRDGSNELNRQKRCYVMMQQPPPVGFESASATCWTRAAGADGATAPSFAGVGRDLGGFAFGGDLGPAAAGAAAAASAAAATSAAAMACASALAFAAFNSFARAFASARAAFATLVPDAIQTSFQLEKPRACVECCMRLNMAACSCTFCLMSCPSACAFSAFALSSCARRSRTLNPGS